ncbi:MAG TPA: hypothetical protein VKG23_14615, partial [Thermoanaerobaculia bacterium]|nr:hypothetical protein [Thermoanaerobaculia bacterium]
MNRGFAAALSAAILLSACGQKREDVLAPVRRAPLKPAARVEPTSPAQWRAELRDAYRLRPDARFLLAVGEIDRLAAGSLPAPPGRPATATFSDQGWVIRQNDQELGTVPEFPDFPDLLAVLVTHAKAVIHEPPGSAEPREALSPSFLMPGLMQGFEAAGPHSLPDASRRFARLAFQLPDPIEVAPLIPARALALLAALRVKSPGAGVEDEILLAHALGYTRHAEKLAATLPSEAVLRAFEALDGAAIEAMASKPRASEEVRYLAVRRSASRGDLASWKDARERFMPGNDSVGVIGTGMLIDLPAQVEVTEVRERIVYALPRAVLRELSRVPHLASPGFEGVDEFRTALKSAAESARGPLWDAAALTAYYEAAHYAPLALESWPLPAVAPTPGLGAHLARLIHSVGGIAPDPKGDTRGAALLVRGIQEQLQHAPPGFEQTYAEIRALVRWLDSRPKDRFTLADRARYSIQDPRLAEALFRSLSETAGDGDRRLRADSAFYLGDWETLHRVLESPGISAPETTAILWSWYTARQEPERLIAEYERANARFPHDWNATNQYIDLLRDRKEYRRACEVVEQWLARNPDPAVPGHFHAHIRLAHNYVLVGQPDRGLAVLGRMQEADAFQRAVIQRDTANCLAAMGRLTEAEAKIREARKGIAVQWEALRDEARILWLEGKDSEATEVLATPRALPEWQLCEALEQDFPEVFLKLPSERQDRAVESVAKNAELARHAECLVRGLGKAGLWKSALSAADRIPTFGSDRMDRLIKLYAVRKKAISSEAAAEWLRSQVPDAQRNPLSIGALYTGNDEVLWDVIGTPNPKDKGEWVWFYRAVSFALLDPDTHPHRTQLVDFYEKTPPGPVDRMGRYLVGLDSDAEMLAASSRPGNRSEMAYCFGVRAQHEGRFSEACEWYRVA